MPDSDAFGLNRWPCVASWSTLPDLSVLEAFIRAPFDAIVLDMQHGRHDTQSVRDGIALAAAHGRPAIVRVPVADYGFVSRALDLGASAVILPMIESASDAKAFVDAAKYPPVGNRSFGPHRAAELFGFATSIAYMEAANRTTLTLAMIETRAAFAALDEILAVEGIDGVFVGPSDLSVALTGRLDPSGSRTVEAATSIAERAKAAGKRAAVYAGDAADARRLLGLGFDLVGVSSDAAILAGAARAFAEAIKA